jgi:hypothetical protein
MEFPDTAVHAVAADDHVRAGKLREVLDIRCELNVDAEVERLLHQEIEQALAADSIPISLASDPISISDGE